MKHILDDSHVSHFWSTSWSLIHDTICRFEAQEVNNPMLQTVHNLELKWRSYNHCKPITPSWRKNFAQCCEITLLLRDDFAAFLYSAMFSPWSFPSRWKSNTTSWKTTSQRCEISRFLRSNFAALFFVPLRNLADLVCTCEMIPSASRYLLPTLGDIFHQIFVV